MSSESLRRKINAANIGHLECFGPIGAAGAVDSWMFKARARLLLRGVSAKWSTASTSGTLMVRKGSTGTPAQGTAMLSAAIDTALTADIEVAGALSATPANLVVEPGQWVSLDWGGTVTNLAGFGLALEFDLL